MMIHQLNSGPKARARKRVGDRKSGVCSSDLRLAFDAIRQLRHRADVARLRGGVER